MHLHLNLHFLVKIEFLFTPHTCIWCKGIKLPHNWPQRHFHLNVEQHTKEKPTICLYSSSLMFASMQTGISSDILFDKHDIVKNGKWCFNFNMKCSLYLTVFQGILLLNSINCQNIQEVENRLIHIISTMLSFWLSHTVFLLWSFLKYLYIPPVWHNEKSWQF